MARWLLSDTDRKTVDVAPYMVVTFKPTRLVTRFDTLDDLRFYVKILRTHGVKFRAYNEAIAVVRHPIEVDE